MSNFLFSGDGYARFEEAQGISGYHTTYTIKSEYGASSPRVNHITTSPSKTQGTHESSNTWSKKQPLHLELPRGPQLPPHVKCLSASTQPKIISFHPHIRQPSIHLQARHTSFSYRVECLTFHLFHLRRLPRLKTVPPALPRNHLFTSTPNNSIEFKNGEWRDSDSPRMLDIRQEFASHTFTRVDTSMQ